jgi:hypothetical protein
MASWTGSRYLRGPRLPSRPLKARRPVTLPAVERPPLPGAVVDAVLRFHDQAEDQGLGRTLLRLSAGRLNDREVESWLGENARRAAGVAILWDERESEIIRVMEAA